MPTALVVGASRGIGKELVRQLREDGYDVIATVRQPDGVSFQGGAKILQLEITDESTVEKAAAEVESLVRPLFCPKGSQEADDICFSAVTANTLSFRIY